MDQLQNALSADSTYNAVEIDLSQFADRVILSHHRDHSMIYTSLESFFESNALYQKKVHCEIRFQRQGVYVLSQV